MLARFAYWLVRHKFGSSAGDVRHPPKADILPLPWSIAYVTAKTATIGGERGYVCATA